MKIAIYIGRAQRNFKMGSTQHPRCYNKNKRNSNYSIPLLDESDSFNVDFTYRKKGLELNLLEVLEINKYETRELIWINWTQIFHYY